VKVFRTQRADVTLKVKMQHPTRRFDPPGFIARAVNRLYGRLTSLGFGPSDSYLLRTRGRKSGVLHSTPVNVLRYNGRIYLIGTRGHTQWSRNVMASGTLTLKRGRTSIAFLTKVLPDEEKAEILKAYLVRFNWMVSRFFPVPATSPATCFAAIASHYPVFELFVSDAKR
jgi:deazaflavin-dependent oxidoreductase (nitroreductase family)